MSYNPKKLSKKLKLMSGQVVHTLDLYLFHRTKPNNTLIFTKRT